MTILCGKNKTNELICHTAFWFTIK